MKPQTLFDRVAFLEAKLTKLERIVQHQTAVLEAAGLTIDADALAAVESPRLRKMREICNDVCIAHDVTLDELKGPSRSRVIAWPRQDAMKLLAQAGYSLPEIGRYLGRRDHTTVLHGIAASKARAAK